MHTKIRYAHTCVPHWIYAFGETAKNKLKLNNFTNCSHSIALCPSLSIHTFDYNKYKQFWVSVWLVCLEHAMNSVDVIKIKCINLTKIIESNSHGFRVDNGHQSFYMYEWKNNKNKTALIPSLKHRVWVRPLCDRSIWNEY